MPQDPHPLVVDPRLFRKIKSINRIASTLEWSRPAATVVAPTPRSSTGERPRRQVISQDGKWLVTVNGLIAILSPRPRQEQHRAHLSHPSAGSESLQNDRLTGRWIRHFQYIVGKRCDRSLRGGAFLRCSGGRIKPTT